MPDTTPGSILDGTPGYGSQVFTFSGSGPFVAESFTITRGFAEAFDEKTDGTPGRARYTQGRAAMTAILQAASNSDSGWPKAGETVTAVFDANYGTEIFILMWVGQERTNDPGALRKINIEMRKQYTSTLTLVAAAAN